MSIPAGASGTAAEITFSMTNASDGSAITSRTWAAGDIKLRLPDGAEGNYTTTNPQYIGGNIWVLRLDAADTTGKNGTGTLRLNIAGVAESDSKQWWEFEIRPTVAIDEATINAIAEAVRFTLSIELVDGTAWQSVRAEWDMLMRGAANGLRGAAPPSGVSSSPTTAQFRKRDGVTVGLECELDAIAGTRGAAEAVGGGG